MALVIETPVSSFDLSEIKQGDVCWAKHRSWEEGIAGFISAATEDELIVQYHPNIGNVTNHAIINVKDVVDDKWQIRWSSDLTEVHTYPEEDPDGSDEPTGEEGEEGL